MAARKFTGDTAPKIEDHGDGTHSIYVAGGGGGGGGGASGDVTAAGVSGTQAQAVQGVDGGVPLTVGNMRTKFRESFEEYIPGVRWTHTIAAGDFIDVDGNVAASSYLVVSKDPLSPSTETAVQTVPTFSMPFDAAIGMALSQRTLGQEFSVEFVSTEAPIAAPPDVSIASISQTTTTLSITTAAAHGLRPGMRFGVRDCADPRFNYPALVVATAPTPTTLTATAGPAGNLPSVTAGPFTSGSVYARAALGYAPNGTSAIFENATATNASVYVRSESGDYLPSGAIPGNHSLTIGTSAPIQAVAAVGAYSFQPTTEYRVTMFVDGVQWSDVGVDSIAASNHRLRRSQVVPDLSVPYRMRVRAVNLPSVTRPVAQIVSVSKTGTTTATVITATPHGLVVGDPINAFGPRDGVNFPALAAATLVASIVSPTEFTIVWGGAVTATSYGGFVAEVNGGQVQQGAIAQAVQSITRTANVLTLVGSAAWAGLVIGDYVNLVSIRDATTGASLGLDGAYRVRDVATTSLVLDVISGAYTQASPATPVTVSPTGGDVVTTNCGGAVLKRTDLRVSYVRVLDFERERVEFTPRPGGDEAASVPVRVNGTANVAGTVTANIAGALAAGTNAVGDVGVQYRANNTGAAAPHHLVAAATTNAANVKASAGRVLGWDLANTTAVWQYVKLHNTAAAPTAGAGVVKTIAIPPNGKSEWSSEGGIGFATGIARTIVTGSADTDATATTLGAVVGDIYFA